MKMMFNVPLGGFLQYQAEALISEAQPRAIQPRLKFQLECDICVDLDRNEDQNMFVSKNDVNG